VSSTTDKRVLSILVNDDFVNHILNPNLILTEMWEDYFSTHPEDIPLAEEAKKILLGELNPTELSAEEAFNLETRILGQCGLSV
jgi:hypothetical protein